MSQAGPPIRVLILASDDPASAALSEGLGRLGWPTVTASDVAGALARLAGLPIEAVLIDLDHAPADAFAAAARLRAQAYPRRLPVIALGRPLPLADPGVFDLTLAPPLHPAQAAQRLESLVRAAVADEEVELRRETLAGYGRALAAPEPDRSPLRVLAVGEPAPKFLALSNAVAAAGAEVTGAFTPYTAFDYLHERAFDAVVLWAGETHAEALSIAGGMRRNTRLYHIPTLLYARAGASVDPGQAFDRGLSDVVGSHTSPEEASARLLSLARAFRKETTTRRALDASRQSGLMDAATGLFTAQLFAAHLARLTAASHARGRGLAMAVLRIADRGEIAEVRGGGWLDRAIPQIGSMIGRLIRAEDTAARLSADVFALALPSTTRPEAQAAADRIAAVIGCTAFEAGGERSPFTVELDAGVAALRPGESAARALDRAAAAAGRSRRTD